jgi:hypothetical protein
MSDNRTEGSIDPQDGDPPPRSTTALGPCGSVTDWAVAGRPEGSAAEPSRHHSILGSLQSSSVTDCVVDLAGVGLRRPLQSQLRRSVRASRR